jgi:NAD(P)-dependent dehydrogenase (short-subunit alcohol dehydrogenase family)
MTRAAGARPVAVVTGARQGIGLGIARALAQGGHDVVVVDRVRDAAAESALAELQSLGARAAFVEADIAQAEAAEALAAACHGAFGAIHTLVNNAGVQALDRAADVLDATPESFDRVMGINLRGTFFLTQAVARRMVADTPADTSAGTPTNAAGQGGPFRAIITISSINAVQARTQTPEYCISKAGLTMLNRIFALRLARHGIACYEIRPGLIATEMTAARQPLLAPLIEGGLTPINRWGQPGDVGAAVATLAAGGMPFCTGEAFHIDGGMQLPRSPLEPAYMQALIRPRA